MLRRTVLAAPLALGLGACAAATEDETPPAPSPTPSPDATTANAGHEFDVALYRALAQHPGNQFISPYSVAAAFALVYPGARGDTAGEIGAAFGFDADQRAATAQSAVLAQSLNATGGSQLDIANAAWVERTMALNAEYARTISGELGATIAQVDFIRNQRAALAQINAWAAHATHDRITEILTQPDPARRLVLTNAVYFKGDWSDQFNARDTHDGPFHAVGGDVTAQLMRQVTRARYFETATFQAAEFEYDQGAFALDVFLPRESSTLASFEQSLSGPQLDAWLGQISAAAPTRLDVMLPKVEMRTDYELSDALQAMGVRRAFTNGADFSGIGTQALAISAVIHKTYLNIDEKGTEAAAVTAIDMVATAAPMPPPSPPIPFHADRPFFMVLCHKASGIILFMGRVTTVAA